jgi:hypothetical protein
MNTINKIVKTSAPKNVFPAIDFEWFPSFEASENIALVIMTVNKQIKKSLLVNGSAIGSVNVTHSHLSKGGKRPLYFMLQNVHCV